MTHQHQDTTTMIRLFGMKDGDIRVQESSETSGKTARSASSSMPTIPITADSTTSQEA